MKSLEKKNNVYFIALNKINNVRKFNSLQKGSHNKMSIIESTKHQKRLQRTKDFQDIKIYVSSNMLHFLATRNHAVNYKLVLEK